VEADPLGRRADVVEPARRDEATAPGCAPVVRVGSALADRRDPAERPAAEPGGADVESAVRVEAEVDAAVDVDVDRRPSRDERDLVDVPEQRRVDQVPTSTVKSTSRL
jgi:hypothetical protein